MNNFRAAVDECGLRDPPWEWYNFLWDNGQVGDANRQCMLDRALCSSTWTDMFPYARIFYLNGEWSDHAPIKLVLNNREEGVNGGRGFKFEKIWAREEGCAKAVERGVEIAENVHMRLKLVAEIVKLRRQGELYWRQRSRVFMLKDGDKNNKFFHTRARERKRKNYIAKLIDDEGVVRHGDVAVGRVANS
ncbi:uncharacterized protein LOC141628729 [Silene latifolia]|uniref:uncharacterized protein LOC141628729 n=1 Tax=Silene latifolia TaxID=37657 RepID=UPI003D7835C4